MRRLFHKDKPVSGLDISTTGIKIMAVDPKKLVVLGYGTVDLDPAKIQESITKGNDYLALGLKNLLKEKLNGHLPSNQVVISVPTSRTYSRIMNVPTDSKASVEDAVQLEVEQYIPMGPSELYLDYSIISETKEEKMILLSAVPKRIVDSIVATCDKSGLEPIMAEPGINATARLVRDTEDGHLPTVIVDIGAATTDVGLLDEGVVRLTGSVAVGGHTFTLRISERLKIPLEEAHQLKIHNGLSNGVNQSKLKLALEPPVGQIISEIHKIIRYYNERIGIKTKIEQVIITGSGSNVPGLGDTITDTIMMPARVANPWQALKFGKLEPPTRQYKSRYTTAAGLGLVDPREIWL